MQLLKANASADRASISAKVEGDEATFYIYDVIDADFGIGASEFVSALSQLDKGSTLNLRINCPGGDVFEARAMATALRQFEGKVVAHIDGLAASAATTIAAVCDEVVIAEGSFYMIHNAWTLALGDKNDFLETAGLLDKVDGAIRADYVARTGATEEQVAAWMDAETWFTADEAVEHGFADKCAPGKKTKNLAAKQWNLAAYDKAPEALTAPDSAPVADEDFAGRRALNARRLRLLEID